MFPLLPNGPYDTFPARTRQLAPGDHLVERLQSWYFIGVTKPGYKGEHDFAVSLFESDGRTRGKSLSHVDMLRDFDAALRRDRARGIAFVDHAFEVFGGAEPEGAVRDLGCVQPTDFIVKSLKWIWAQEDINYPMPRYQGRKMAGFRLQELVDGVPLATVLARAEVKGRPPPEIGGVHYDRVVRALRPRRGGL
ncbi:MAG: hypothetical protein FJ102_09470 [Deltaproteobacteria bacterium]|nr:hypothetical protein [Deltaproteobacteria bacterium]